MLKDINSSIYMALEAIPHILIPVRIAVCHTTDEIYKAFDFIDRTIIDLCLELGIEDSKNKCKRLIENGGLYLKTPEVTYLTETKITSTNDIITKNFLQENLFFLLRKGKKTYGAVYLENTADALERAFSLNQPLLEYS